MADLINCLLSLPFGLPDAAAAPSTAVALVPGYGAGAPDAADINGFVMPKAGAVVGLTLLGQPTQSGDNQQVQVYKNGTAIASAVLSNAYNAAAQAGASLVLNKDDSTGTTGNVFAAGDIIAVKYKTVTGGTYGVKDIGATVIVQLGLSE